MVDLERQLKAAVKTGKVTVGRKEVANSLKATKLLVWSASANLSPQLLKQCQSLEIPSVRFDGNPIELGKMAGIPYKVSVLSVKSGGDAKLDPFSDSKDYSVRKGPSFLAASEAAPAEGPEPKEAEEKKPAKKSEPKRKTKKKEEASGEEEKSKTRARKTKRAKKEETEEEPKTKAKTKTEKTSKSKAPKKSEKDSDKKRKTKKAEEDEDEEESEESDEDGEDEE